MLHDFVLYDTRTGKITGHFRTTTPGLLPTPPSPYHSQIPVIEEEHRQVLRDQNQRGRLVGTVETNKIVSLRVEPRFKGKVELTCDVSDLDKDGRAELAADGASVARISATLVAADGTTARNESSVVRFEVSRGSLARRDVTPEEGVAVVDLKSSTETVQSTVVARAEGFESGSLVLEFIPPEEHRMLRAANPKTAR